MNRNSMIVLSLIAVIAGCAPDCGNDVFREVASPDRKHIATVFERNCGATTDYVRVVMIRDKSDRFDGDDVDEFIFTMQGRHNVDVRWVNANHLVIVRPERTQDIFKNRDSWKGIKITYSPDQ